MIQFDMIDFRTPGVVAKKFAGNWKRIPGFAAGPQLYEADHADDWGTTPICHRDSTLLDESNAAEIVKLMDRPEWGDDVSFGKAGSDMVGWIQHINVRVWTPDGRTYGDEPDCSLTDDQKLLRVETEAFTAFQEIMMRLENYAILNETDYSEREFEASCEGVSSALDSLYWHMGIEKPDNSTDLVYDWLADHFPGEVESVDDRGAYPCELAILAAVQALFWDELPDEWQDNCMCIRHAGGSPFKIVHVGSGETFDTFYTRRDPLDAWTRALARIDHFGFHFSTGVEAPNAV